MKCSHRNGTALYNDKSDRSGLYFQNRTFYGNKNWIVIGHNIFSTTMKKNKSIPLR